MNAPVRLAATSVEAIDWAVKNKMQVVNMSLGYAFMSWPGYPTGVASNLLVENGVAILVTRGEMGEYIADGAENAGMKQVYRCGTHEAAGCVLRELLEPGDTILFKGSRGMQMEKIIGLL